MERMTQEGLDLLGYGITIFDRDLNLVRFNQKFLELLGYPVELGKAGTPFEAFVRFNAEQGLYGDADIEDQIKRRIELAKSFTPHFFRRKAPNGVVVEIEGHPLSDGGFVTTYTDVTEGKSGRATANRLGRILDETSSEIYIFNARTLKFIQANRGARLNLGYSMVELGGMTPIDIKPEFNEARFRKMIELLVKGPARSLTFQTLHERKSGLKIPVELSLQYVAPIGEDPRFVAFVRDISDRKQAERDIREKSNLLETLNRVQSQYIATGEAFSLFEQILGETLTLTSSEYGYIGEVFYGDDGEPFLMTHAVSTAARKNMDHEKGGKAFLDLDTLVSSVIKDGCPVIVNNSEKCTPRAAKHFCKSGTKSSLASTRCPVAP